MTAPFCACQSELLQTSRHLSMPCIPNLPCDHFNQLCLAKGKIAPAELLLHEAK